MGIASEHTNQVGNGFGIHNMDIVIFYHLLSDISTLIRAGEGSGNAEIENFVTVCFGFFKIGDVVLGGRLAGLGEFLTRSQQLVKALGLYSLDL